MKSKMKLLLGFIFSFGLFLTSNAQSDTMGGLPAEDQIVCRQVEENVFDCTVEGDFEDLDTEEDIIDDSEKNMDTDFNQENLEDQLNEGTPEINDETEEPSIEQNYHENNSDMNKKKEEPTNTLTPEMNEAIRPEIKVECQVISFRI